MARKKVMIPVVDDFEPIEGTANRSYSDEEIQAASDATTAEIAAALDAPLDPACWNEYATYGIEARQVGPSENVQLNGPNGTIVQARMGDWLCRLGKHTFILDAKTFELLIVPF